MIKICNVEVAAIVGSPCHWIYSAEGTHLREGNAIEEGDTASRSSPWIRNFHIMGCVQPAPARPRPHSMPPI